MKSLIYVIITLYMFNCVLSEETQLCEDKTPTKISDCTNYQLTDDEKADGNDACCYVSYTDPEEEEEVTGCGMGKKDEIDEVTAITRVVFPDFTINCEPDPDSGSDSDSVWLSLSLTVLLFALLF